MRFLLARSTNTVCLPSSGRQTSVPKVFSSRASLCMHVGRASAAAMEPQATVHAATAVDESFTSPSPVLDIDEAEYTPQLERKLSRLNELFSTLCPPGESLPQVEVFTSAPSHYRQRAEFTVWGTSAKASQQGPPDVHFIMYDSKSSIKPPPRVRIDRFPVGSRLMNGLMQVVIAAANQMPELRERLFQVNFHTALSGESMVTLIYHKKLDDVWQEAAKQLRTKLAQVEGTQGHMPHVIGRSRKQKVELDQSYVTERLVANGRTYTYRQLEASFSQPNAGVCQHMLSWAQTVTTPPPATPAPAATQASTSQAGSQPTEAAAPLQGDTPEAANPSGSEAAPSTEPSNQARQDAGIVPNRHDHDLLELYCGNGNFTIPLARNFRRVIATEVSKTGVEAARHNITENGVDNIFVARMSSEEFSEAWLNKTAKKRLEGMGDWADLNLRTVLVDPPRAGLDGQTLKLIADNFDNIVYISCNPETLLENLRVLMPTHRVDKFAAFDQFPYTHHQECGVYLTRRA